MVKHFFPIIISTFYWDYFSNGEKNDKNTIYKSIYSHLLGNQKCYENILNIQKSLLLCKCIFRPNKNDVVGVYFGNFECRVSNFDFTFWLPIQYNDKENEWTPFLVICFSRKSNIYEALLFSCILHLYGP